jgi:replicative DNA helicase
MAVNIKKEFGNTRSHKPDLTSLVYGKIPPQAPELEEAVLGVIMLERDKLEIVFSILPEPECFYLDKNQNIYSAIKDMYVKGMQIDLLTITDELRRNEVLELIGGAYYLTQLAMSVVSGAHVESHARIIKEKFIQRELIRVAGQIIGDAYEDSTDVFDLLDKADQELSKLTQNQVKKDFKHISKPTKKVLDEMSDKRMMEVEFTGTPTGFREVDACTGGWQNTDLIILAARPGVGKTAFVLNLALNAAMDQNSPSAVAIFSLEMGADQLIQRMLANISEVELKKIRIPIRMTDSEFDKVIGKGPVLSQIPIFIDDTPALSGLELRAKSRRLKNKHDIQLLIIDYLQLMDGDSGKGGKSFNREGEISKITRDLKSLAKELEIPIIALSQLNRDVEKRAKNRPMLSDLRESGSIEQDADLVMFLYRPSEDEIKADASLAGIGTLDIQKHRNGNPEKIVLSFNPQIQKWSEYNSESSWNNSQPDFPTNNYKTMNQVGPFSNQAPPQRTGESGTFSNRIEPGGTYSGNEKINDLPF